jgi:hypothetical protein
VGTSSKTAAERNLHLAFDFRVVRKEGKRGRKEILDLSFDGVEI